MARRSKAAAAPAEDSISDDEMIAEVEGDEPGSATRAEDRDEETGDETEGEEGASADDDDSSGAGDAEGEANGAAAAAGNNAASAAGAAKQASTAAAAAPAAPDWMRQLNERYQGVNFGATPDEVFSNIDRVMHAANQAQQLRQQAQIGQQVMGQWDEFQRWQQQQALAAQAQQQAEQKPKMPWELPEFDPAAEQMVEWQLDEATGQRVPVAKQYADPTLPQKIIARRQAERQALGKFLESPIDTLWDGGLQDRIDAHLSKALEARFGQERQQQFVASTVSQHMDWIAEKDAQGRAQFDPITGSPILSREGQLYVQQVADLEAAGVRDPQHQHALALRYVEALRQNSPTTVTTQQGATTVTPAQGATPKQTLAERNRAELDKRRSNAAERRPQRNGGQGSRAPARAKNGMSLEERMRARFKDQGLLETVNVGDDDEEG